MIGLVVAVAGIAAFSTTTVHASKISSNYSFNAEKSGAGSVPYTVKSSVKSGYIWNYSHTKKIHNIKNYPNSNWYVNYASVKKYNQKSAVYYRISSNSGNVKGLIWSGYLTRLLSKAPSEFNTQSSFETYMQTARSQRLARQVMKLFPNSKLSLDLSQITQNVNANHPLKTEKYTGIINVGVLKPTGNTDTLSISEKVGGDMAGGAITPRATYIKRVLENNGFTQEKRNSMSNYYLGIYMPDNAQVMSDFPKNFSFTSPYPMENQDEGMNGIVQIFLAKLK
ncbi:D-alanyl-D-alanine carboxypeptidase [Secundilactobacillus folii]|uniref:D-alanyl-D-alanine carboxypeptidase n=1 Tax=Secundilactobacillus folii TaxID=2678357 RepID=A0A7X2XWB7_9LACO|nr:D-alanyl-D-alanine carboxypeptidase [Secundilactobacillus folii]MTV82809.1 D-alanyl-D-alanine carboxypeptidase [Secundilactobacillus folii]